MSESEKTTSEVMAHVFESLLGTEEGAGAVEETIEETSPEEPGGEEDAQEEGQVEESVEEEAGEEGEEETRVSPGELTAPQHWPKEARETFATLPEDAQEFLLKTYKGMEADYTRKSQGVADVKRALDPVRGIMQKFNISDAVAVQNLVNTYMQLVDNPVKGIQNVMRAYKLELDDLSAYWEDPDRFAEESGRKVESLERRLEEQTKSQQQAEFKRHLEYINNWAKDKEFFDQVEQEMADKVAVVRMRGEQPDLDKLYDEACWAVPEIREKLLERSTTKGLVESVEERKRKVARAKSASKAIKPSATSESTKEPTPPKTTDEAMKQVWDEMSKKGVA